MHDTGAALTGVAADMRSGQAEMIAKKLNEKRAILGIARDLLAVDRQFDRRHRNPPQDDV
jgi:hypothetical protein